MKLGQGSAEPPWPEGTSNAGMSTQASRIYYVCDQCRILRDCRRRQYDNPVLEAGVSQPSLPRMLSGLGVHLGVQITRITRNRKRATN
jgi:hypothetical protein